ncbi:hypothetical protein [Catenibacterium sp.]|uniref:hypothetical protein n=1 Tax=Catenibacterium sp. TaxID=2049022 RepID=UPI0039932F7A
MHLQESLQNHAELTSDICSSAQNQKPSHQAFQRFIHDDLIMSVEDIFYRNEQNYGR